MKKRHINITELWIGLILIAGTNFLNLFSTQDVIGLKRDDMLLILILVGYIVHQLCNGKRLYLPIRNRWLFLFPIFLGIMASVVSTIMWKQSLLDGIRAQRVFMLVPIGYYWITDVLRKELLSVEKIKALLSRIARVELILILVQCILYEKIEFLILKYESTFRSGYAEVRLRTDLILISVAFFIWLSDFLNMKERLKNAICMLITFIILIAFVKTRMLFLGYLTIIPLVAYIWKAKKVVYKIAVISVLLVALIYITRMDFFQAILQTITSRSDTVAVRDSGRQWYLEALENSPIFGLGYPHESCEAACNAAGFNNEIYITDNGIWGFAYIYGLIGMCWLLLFWKRFVHRGYILAKYKRNYIYILYMIFNIVISRTLAYFMSYGLCMFVWVMLMAMCEKEITSSEIGLYEEKNDIYI